MRSLSLIISMISCSVAQGTVIGLVASMPNQDFETVNHNLTIHKGPQSGTLEEVSVFWKERMQWATHNGDHIGAEKVYDIHHQRELARHEHR